MRSEHRGRVRRAWLGIPSSLVCGVLTTAGRAPPASQPVSADDRPPHHRRKPHHRPRDTGVYRPRCEVPAAQGTMPSWSSSLDTPGGAYDAHAARSSSACWPPDAPVAVYVAPKGRAPHPPARSFWPPPTLLSWRPAPTLARGVTRVRYRGKTSGGTTSGEGHQRRRGPHAQHRLRSAAATALYQAGGDGSQRQVSFSASEAVDAQIVDLRSPRTRRTYWPQLNGPDTPRPPRVRCIANVAFCLQKRTLKMTVRGSGSLRSSPPPRGSSQSCTASA